MLKSEAIHQGYQVPLGFFPTLASGRLAVEHTCSRPDSVFLGNLIIRAKPKDANRIVPQGNSPAKQATRKISCPTRHKALLDFYGSLSHRLSGDNSLRT